MYHFYEKFNSIFIENYDVIDEVLKNIRMKTLRLFFEYPSLRHITSTKPFLPSSRNPSVRHISDTSTRQFGKWLRHVTSTKKLSISELYSFFFSKRDCRKWKKLDRYLCLRPWSSRHRWINRMHEELPH